MSAFWSKKKDSDAEKKEATKQASQKVNEGSKKKSQEKVGKKAKKKSAKKVLNLGEKAGLVNEVILSPVVSEDAMTKEELGKYVFLVNKKATKNEIMKAISAKYDIKVLKVNVINYKSQEKSFRRSIGRTKSYKKAIVTVEAGKKIDLFSSK